MTQSLPPKNLVLYADDDQDDREFIKDAFKDFRHAVDLMTFPNGSQLLRYLETLSPLQPNPCLIILDINMPLMNGKETLRQLRQLKGFEDVPAVLFTTSTLPSEMAFARQYNAGFVNKPLNTPQIQQIVDQLIDHCTHEVKQKIRGKN